MKDLFDNLAEIIKASAQSNLGIFALLAIALAVLAYFFFARTSEKIKAGIFTMLFLGVAVFGVAMFKQSQPSDTPAPAFPTPLAMPLPAPAPAVVTAGLPSGYGMKVCGCWGPNPNPTEMEPRCASGYVRINVCAGSCSPGHPPYAYVCM